MSGSPTRRDLLKGTAAAGMAAALGCAAPPRRRDLIRGENEKPGTADWQIARSRVDPRTKYRSPWIEGFCSRTSQGTGEFLLWEFPVAYWLEGEGYDVSYVSNVDTHADGPGLRRAKGFLSVGHDEYWTLEMYANVKGAVAEGLNVAFLSGNTCYGVIPLLPSSAGAPHRVITRLGRFGPIEDQILRDYPEYRLYKIREPRDADLVGAGCGFAHINVGADWICASEKHWVFEGTGMKNGEAVPGLVGWETQGDLGSQPGLEVVARGRVVNNHKVEGTYAATVYPGPKGNVVFNAATIWWGDGLAAPPGYRSPQAWGARPRGPDPRIQRITKNVLDRFRG